MRAGAHVHGPAASPFLDLSTVNSIASSNVASILVYMEIEGQSPGRPSLEALGEARRMATSLGAALYAFVALDGPITDEIEDHWVPLLGDAGADKIVLMPGSAPGGPGPRLWPDQGRGLHAACMRLSPLVVMIAATSTGRDIAPRLAARTGATFFANAAVEYGAAGQARLRRTVYAHGHTRTLDLHDLAGPVVITLLPNAHQLARGHDEAEVLRMALPAARARIRATQNPVSRMLGNAPVPAEDTATRGPALSYLDSVDDPGAALDAAEVIVVAGGGVDSAEDYALVAELARAMGAELAATPTLVARGLAPGERAVGAGHRHVSPAVYVVCAASGSAAHLAAVSPAAVIIAINADAGAPIFAVASYGLVGPLDTVLPALIAALNEQGAATPW